MGYMSTWFSSSQLRSVVMEERATELVEGVPSQQLGFEYNRHDLLFGSFVFQIQRYIG